MIGQILIRLVQEGRFVSGITETAIGNVRVIGVAIPYFNYRTRQKWGAKRLKQNEGKEKYLRVLSKLLMNSQYQHKTIIVGDYNLAIPAHHNYPPKHIDTLRQAVFADWIIPTANASIALFSPMQKQSLQSDKHIIDHVAHTPDFMSRSVWRWYRYHEDGTRLSDHDGIFVSLTVPESKS